MTAPQSLKEIAAEQSYKVDVVHPLYQHRMIFLRMPDGPILDSGIGHIKEASARAKACGMNISEYTLRRIIRSGELPCRIVGRTYLISWEKLVAWATCADGCDNAITQ